MTAALYDVKAKLSEYVTLAEDGDVIEITKHGKVCAVIVSKKDYDECFIKKQRKNPVEQWRKWRASLSEEDLKELQEAGEEYCRFLEEERKRENNEKERENPWL